ncbi:MarR family winged helix-turn-helix transcriptional regulator [Micromonospora parastrephiae]|uniref:MarR family winged helix-turn-helix transcriptional regulator n=1 Tax=Micromonospora parastrephiae TaxID=2806101 RepID=UPI001EE48E3D|nr:MarR family winged helix-turn-helix transcriptional regulator [Micromonospora parastrephiae]
MSDDHSADTDAEEATLGRIETEVALLMRFGEATRRATGTAEHRVLDRAAYVILRHLADAGPHNVSALAARLNLDGSTVTRQVSALQRDGLIVRAADPTDGRGTVISPTPAACSGWPPCRPPAPGSTATCWPTGAPRTAPPWQPSWAASTRPWSPATAAANPDLPSPHPASSIMELWWGTIGVNHHRPGTTTHDDAEAGTAARGPRGGVRLRVRGLRWRRDRRPG